MVPKPPARAPDGMLELVTTRLELKQPPRVPRVSITGRTVALVRAKHFPLHFYRYLYDHVGSPYLWWERREMDDEQLASIVQDERVELHVLQVDGAPAGFAELDRRIPGEVELAYLGLVPEYLGQGLGRFLTGRAVELAWRDDDVHRVVVHACSIDHPRALLVYQQIGFAAFDEIRERIEDPRDRGLFPEHEDEAANEPPGSAPDEAPDP